jgi:hypothetical protein
MDYRRIVNQIVVGVAVAALASAAQADTIFVDDDNCPGPGPSEGDPYCSIQTAIDNAVDTDEIVVAPGTYFETINFLGKAVWLHSSDGPGVTIIDGHFSDRHVVTCRSGEGPETVLDGFTVTRGFPEVGGGMYNSNSSPTVINCWFVENAAYVCPEFGNCGGGSGGGMYNGNSSPTVISCVFRGNWATYGGGVNNSGGSSATFVNCLFAENVAVPIYEFNTGWCVADGTGSAIYSSNSVPLVAQCTIAYNQIELCVDELDLTPDLGVFGGGLLSGCIVWGNYVYGYGEGRTEGPFAPTSGDLAVQYSDVEGGYPGTGNIDADPLFVDPANGDLRLSPASPCIDAADNHRGHRLRRPTHRGHGSVRVPDPMPVGPQRQRERGRGGPAHRHRQLGAV